MLSFPGWHVVPPPARFSSARWHCGGDSIRFLLWRRAIQAVLWKNKLTYKLTFKQNHCISLKLESYWKSMWLEYPESMIFWLLLGSKGGSKVAYQYHFSLGLVQAKEFLIQHPPLFEPIEPRKKKNGYFPLNPGCLIGIFKMVCYNPYITG